jgi:hypothetical protein
MINQKSVATVEASTFGSHFRKPLYSSYCFSKIPGTIKHLLGYEAPHLPVDCFKEGAYDTVVFFLVDAFGWELFEKYAHKYPFLKRCLDSGIVSKLTSQFPSTTTAHITCLNHDLEVGQHGIYEWFYYEPTIDAVIAPLLYSFAGDKQPGTLQKTGLCLKTLCPFETVYEQLHARGIASTIFQHASIGESPYSQWVFRGAEHVSYTTLTQGLDRLMDKITTKRGYFYLYFGDIDAAAHRHGVHSKEVEAAVDECFKALEEHFWKKLQKSERKIALLLTADHGMMDIDPQETYYLNLRIPEIVPMIQKNRQGKPIVPAGSCRDFFLHIIPERMEEALTPLRGHLEGIAGVYPTKELINHKFFGDGAYSDAFLQRVGNIVILPYGHNAVWWYEKHHFEQRFNAMHGGLTRHEVETPLLFLDF